MKKYLILFLVICAFRVAAQTNSDQQEIRSLLENQRAAWNKGDIKTYMQGYTKSDSLLFVGKSGPTYGWQKTLDNYKKSYPDQAAMGYLTFGIKKISFLSKDVAFVLGSWNLKREQDEPKGFFTLIIKKNKGKWEIAVDHSS